MLFAAPTAFRRLLDAGDAHALRPLRYALSAAAPLGEDLAREWEAQQMTPLYQGYGLTESSPFATYNHEDRIVLNTVGRPIAGVELRVGAIDSEEWLTPGEVGEVAIRGPNVMAGYWRRPDATARALRGGWLRTGDVGSLDEAGYLRLTDRLDDVVNVGGFKAYPSDVERVINAHAAVQESMAYTLPDAQLGARVGAFVVVRRGVMLDERELLRFLETRLSRYQRPVSISFTSELPRTSAGKLLRRGAATHVASTRHAAAARSTL